MTLLEKSINYYLNYNNNLTMSYKEDYNRIHNAYKYSNSIQKNPVKEQLNVRKTSTAQLLNTDQNKEHYEQRPSQIRQTISPVIHHSTIPTSIPSNLSTIHMNQSSVNAMIPIHTTPSIPIHGPLVPPTPVSPSKGSSSSQVSPEMVKQVIEELKKQSPHILENLLKDISSKAVEYIHPTVKDPKTEQKKVSKTAVSNIVNPLDILGSKLSTYAENMKKSIEVFTERWAGQIKIPTTYKYVDIDSTYRNRNLYPNPCSFVIPFTNLASKNSGITAEDPVFLGYPYVMGMVSTISNIVGTKNQRVSDFSSPPLPSNYDSNISNSSTILIPNFYYNYLLEIITDEINYTSEFSTIISNDSVPSLVVSPGFSIFGGSLNVKYRIRKDIPILKGLLPAGSSQNQIILSSDASKNDDEYEGCLLILYDPLDLTIITNSVIITEYNSNTLTATLAKSLPIAPSLGTPYDIVKFSYDNLNPLRYSGSLTLNEPVCYDILLLHLVVPFNPISGRLNIKGGNGGSLKNYPYLYVHFYNQNRHSQTTIYGNNPNANIVTFKVTLDNPIMSVLNPSANVEQGQFVVFNNINVSAPQNIKLSITDSLRFRVTLPNGDDLIYDIPDNYSPLPPNPRVQFSAMIGISRASIPPGSGIRTKIIDGYED